MLSDHSSKCFRDGHYHMILRERKIFVISWQLLDLRFTEIKEINNNTLSSKLFIHLSNSIFLLEFFLL